MDETIWAMSAVRDRHPTSTGITHDSYAEPICRADGEPLQYRAWMRLGSHKVLPQQHYVTRDEAVELALKFAEALEATYFMGLPYVL